MKVVAIFEEQPIICTVLGTSQRFERADGRMLPGVLVQFFKNFGGKFIDTTDIETDYDQICDRLYKQADDFCADNYTMLN